MGALENDLDEGMAKQREQEKAEAEAEVAEREKRRELRDTLIRVTLQEFLNEYARARQKHGNPMRSAHEGISILREEFEEAWDEVKRDNVKGAKKEMIQVGAMALAFLLEVHDE